MYYGPSITSEEQGADGILCLERILADGEGSQLLSLLRGRLGGLSAGDMNGGA